MTNEWQTYKVSIRNFELLLSARSEDEAKMTVLDSLKKCDLSDRLKLSGKDLELKITRAKGLQR